MFYYRIGFVCIIFEQIAESTNTWQVQAWKYGTKDESELLFQKSANINVDYTYARMYSEALKQYRKDNA